MQDLKNLNCLLPKTKELLLDIEDDNIDYLEPIQKIKKKRLEIFFKKA